MAFDKNDLKRRMDSTVDVLKTEFAGLRTGRASTSMLDPIMVDAYGSAMPISQVGSISAPEARLLTVQVWDNGLVKSVEKAIRDANLGLNPQPDGNLVRIPIPELNEERRKEISKIAGKYAEQARVAVRNVRREGMEAIKKAEKDKQMSEDDAKRNETEVQKLTDDAIKKVDTMLSDKEKDLLKV
mgnify:CR=1 FL=1